MLALFGTGSVRAGTNVWTSLGTDRGIVNALAIDPQNPGTVYAATDGGLFKSEDEGAGWTAVNPGPPCCLLTLIIDPQNSSAIYAVTRVDRRVLKSTDGGANWSPLTPGLPVDADGHSGVTSLAMDPKNPATLYVGIALKGAGGVFKSTDGGESWNAASAGLPGSGVMALAVNPQNPEILYASTQTDGIFNSTDGAAGWGAFGNGLAFSITHGYNHISLLVIDPQNPNTIYAAGHNALDVEDSDYGLFRTTNAGASWTGLFDDTTVRALAADPQNPGTVYAVTYGAVYKSVDGGTRWSVIKFRLTDDPDGSLVISALAIDPQNSNTVYAARTYAGLLKTADAGASWTTVNSNLRATTPTSVIALRADAKNAGTIYAATEAGLFKTTDAGVNWTGVNAGLPTDPFGHLPLSILEIDPQNPSTLYTVDPCCVNPFKSTDGGASWSAVYDATRGARLYANALAIDPRNPSTVYAAGSFGQSGFCPGCGGGVFQSIDGAVHWIAVNAGLPASSGEQSVFISTLAIDPQNPRTIYAGATIQSLSPRGNLVFKTTDGGASWKSAGLAGFSRADILAIDPQNSNTVYARAVDRIGRSPQRAPVPGGFDGCGWLYKSTNGGASWSVVNAGLPNYVTALAIDPRNPGTLYAGSGSGVFRSTDGGASWSSVNSGLTTLSVSTLATDSHNPGTVYAGASDGGVFAITFAP